MNNVKLKNSFTDNPNNYFLFHGMRSSYDLEEMLPVKKNTVWDIKKKVNNKFILTDPTKMISMIVYKDDVYPV